LIRSVAFSPDGSKIVSGSFDKTIRVWDASTGIEMLPPLRGHDDRILSVAFSPDGSKIVSGSSDKTIRVWDASTGVEMLPPLRGHDYLIWSVAFSPDGSKIVSGSDDKTIRVWDASTGNVLPRTETAVDDIFMSALDPMEGEWFTNINTGRCVGRPPVGASFRFWRGSRVYICWMDDGTQTCTCSFPCAVYIIFRLVSCSCIEILCKSRLPIFPIHP
jgi:WD40 repeat protein